jgi:putative membrane protein
MFIRYAASSLAVFALSLAAIPQASTAALEADKVFVGKVSQGGMYEVEASKLAQQKATAPDVVDLAVMEVHDHTLVNNGLKKVAAQENIPVSDTLNSTFQQRLQTLQGESGAEFEAAYLTDMEQIHAMDEKLFAQEATNGSPNFQPFARQTDLIVKRHIGALHALDAN